MISLYEPYGVWSLAVYMLCKINSLHQVLYLFQFLFSTFKQSHMSLHAGKQTRSGSLPGHLTHTNKHALV